MAKRLKLVLIPYDRLHIYEIPRTYEARDSQHLT